MPKSNGDVPKTLKPFTFHGVRFHDQSGDNARADCVLCGREGKFFVNDKTGLWDCKKCGACGNPLQFVRLLAESLTSNERELETLARDRGISPATMQEWGVRKHRVTGEYCLIGYAPDGKVGQLYRYVKVGDKKQLLATPELPHQMHFAAPPTGQVVYVCEGPWDGMLLWETLRGTREAGGKLVPTANPESSLLASRSVVAVPGCNVFGDSWRGMFAGRDVVLMYDSDHERENAGQTVPPAGWSGARRVAGKLAAHEEPPASVSVLTWGPSGYDPDLPSGFDVRDALRFGGARAGAERISNLAKLLEKVLPIPDDWVPGRSRKTSARGGTTIESEPCREWKVLVNAWRKAMKWPPSGEGLDHALACMLASVTSTKAVGDQLWMKIIGPASCGKSTLCEALSVSRKFVLAKSTIRGFHSGFGNHEDEDNSLLATVKDKTLVTKDGDTLLQSPNLGQILSEARDVYDRTSRTHYRNKMSKDYEGINMTWLLCGTSSLRSIDSSELGERFLDCVIMEEIDADTEDEILDRVAEKADAAMSLEADGAVETQYAPDLLLAMRLTGGYVEHLRESAQSLLHGVTCGPGAKDQLKTLAKFVSYMRARPSSRQDEQAEREFSARLLSQLLRLGKCLGAVLNRREVDDDVMARVRRVAFDTARGRTLNIVRKLAEAGAVGMETDAVSVVTAFSRVKTQEFLRFLRVIGAVEPFEPTSDDGKKRGRLRWRLTKRFAGIYAGVAEGL